MTSIRTFARAATSAVAAAALALGAVAIAAAPATALESDTAPYFEFDVNADGTATITSCPWSNCNYRDVTIPPTISANGTDHYDVTAIADGAFDTYFLTSVTLPEGLESIGDRAFAGNDLSEITLPSTLVHVGTKAFYRSSLGDLTIPASLTDMGDDAFHYAGITSLTWEGSPTTISHGAFNSNELTSVTIPPSVTSIGESAFSGNYLTSVTLPPHLETIGDGAFSDNRDLADVTYPGAIPTAPQFPSTLTSIGNYAFSFAALPELTLPDGLTHLGEYAFSDNAIEFLELADSLATIPPNAFAWNALAFVVIPGAVTDIGAEAFTQNPIAMIAFLGDEPLVGQNAFGDYIFSGTQPPAVIYDLASTGFGYPTWTAGGTTFPTAPGTSVEFVTDYGITPEPQSVAYGELVPEPGELEADWHDFLGWFTEPEGGEQWDFETDTVTSGLTLYAQWEAVTHTVTFEFGSHAPDAVVAVDHNDTVAAPEAPFLPGHRFAGWTLAGEPADLASPITADLTVTALYEASTYAVQAPSEVDPGDEITVTGTGFDPDETVTLELHSTPVGLGTTTADAAGAFSASVTIPADAPAGDHEIVALGAAGQASNAITLTAAPQPEPVPTDGADPTPEPTTEHTAGPTTDPTTEPTTDPTTAPTTEPADAEQPEPEVSGATTSETLATTGPANGPALLVIAIGLALAGAAVIGSLRVSRGTGPRSR